MKPIKCNGEGSTGLNSLRAGTEELGVERETVKEKSNSLCVILDR